MYHTGIHPIVHNRRKVLDMVFLYFYFYGCALVSTLSVEQKKKRINRIRKNTIDLI